MSKTPAKFWDSMPSGDKMFFLNVLAGIVVWWFLSGRDRYSMKGMKARAS